MEGFVEFVVWTAVEVVGEIVGEVVFGWLRDGVVGVFRWVRDLVGPLTSL